MRYALGLLIKKKQAITYINDSKLQEQEIQEKLTVRRDYLAFSRDTILKAAPDKPKFFLHKMKFLGPKNSIGTLCPINSRNAHIQINTGIKNQIAQCFNFDGII